MSDAKPAELISKYTIRPKTTVVGSLTCGDAFIVPSDLSESWQVFEMLNLPTEGPRHAALMLGSGEVRWLDFSVDVFKVDVTLWFEVSS